MRATILISTLILSCFANAQDTIRAKWKKERSYPIDTMDVWTVDALENVYIAGQDMIDKYDSIGVLKFSQSIKSLGAAGQFEAINTMKLVHFSTSQQTLCFFDNTLTQSEICLDLGEFDIYSAGLIATSSRPDKVWVLDNLNSKLLLMDISGKLSAEEGVQAIETENLKGVLDLRNAVQLIERDSRLYILDAEHGVYIFDIYGSLIDLVDISGGEAVDATGTSVFVLSGDHLVQIDLKSGRRKVISLPLEGVEGFRIMNKRMYLRTTKNVHKYRLL